MSYKKKALIFGIYSQNGSYLAHFLNSKRYKVFGSSRKNNQHSNIKKLNLNNKIKVFKTNTQNIDKVKLIIKITKCSEIYYFSEISPVNVSLKKPFETFNYNVTSLYNILESCRQLKFKGKIYNAGSSECFRETSKEINQLSLFNPRSPYALSKIICHYLVKSYRENFNLWCCTGFLSDYVLPLRKKNFDFKKIITLARKIKKKLNIY